MDTKTTGYIFLAIGLVIMIFSVLLVILAFTNVIKPKYFSFSSPQNSAPLGQSRTPNDFKSLTEEALSQNALGQPSMAGGLLSSLNILPAGALDSMLNLSAHFFLMTFVGGFGYKLSMIGVNLIRPIVVKTGNRTLDPS